MVSRNIASKGFKTVKLQHQCTLSQPTVLSEMSFFFFIWFSIVGKSDANKNYFGKDGEGGHYHIHLNKKKWAQLTRFFFLHSSM